MVITIFFNTYSHIVGAQETFVSLMFLVVIDSGNQGAMLITGMINCNFIKTSPLLACQRRHFPSLSKSTLHLMKRLSHGMGTTRRGESVEILTQSRPGWEVDGKRGKLKREGD